MNRISYSYLFVFLIACVIIGCSNRQHQKNITGADSVKSSDSLSLTADQISPMNLTYEQRQGKYVFTKYCATCHGDDGKGDGFNAFNLDPKPRDFTDQHLMNALDDERIIRTITGGGRSVNRSNLMPSWGGRLSKGEIQYVAAYVRLFAPVQ